MVQLALVLLLAGIYLRYQLRQVFEKELGLKLQSLAGAVAVQMDPSLLPLLAPGDEDSRLYQGLRQRLVRIAQAADLRRIMVFSPQGQVWLDSEGLTPIGSIYVRKAFDQAEIARAVNGIAASSVLFEGRDRVLYKSAYVPMFAQGRVVGIVMVEGNARSLKAIGEIQRRLLQIGITAAIFSLLMAVAMAWQLSRPILKLQQEAKRIGQGKIDRPIHIEGRDEVAFLAKTMEEMRHALLQREEQQKAMLAGVAHEIRNPLGGIELFAGLLRDELTDEALRQKADRILLETKNLKTLVQNFLDFARPVLPKPQVCRISEILVDCCELLQNEMKEKKIQLVVVGDGLIMADPQHLKQMLMNLLLNGTQSMEANGRLEIKIDKNHQVMIDIKDQGHGIAMEDQEKIFTPFFTTKERGLGLGLAMVKTLAEANGGSIRLMHSDSSGSWFRLILPAA